MKVGIVFLLAIVVVFMMLGAQQQQSSVSVFNRTSNDNLYKDPRAVGVGAALVGQGAYGWLTRGWWHQAGTQLNMGRMTRRSIAASRAYSLLRAAGGAAILGLNRYYTSNQQPAAGYYPIKSIQSNK